MLSEPVLGFFLRNWTVLLFYSIIILLLFIFRKKFDVHGIVALYRTKIGLALMEKIGTRHAGIVRLLGYIGIGVGFVGMIFILYALIQNIITLLSTPSATSGVSLVIPGVKIPGSPITPPLILGWIALFVVVLVHEFAHGVVSVAHNVKVKASGIAFFGPLMGAFVEPDEKTLTKRHETAQYAVFAAGPWSNVILAVLAMLLLSFAVAPLISAITTPAGFSVAHVQDGTPAALANIPTGITINQFNNNTIQSVEEFQQHMQNVGVGDVIVLNNEYTITTTPHPDNTTRAYIGISGLKNELALRSESIPAKASFSLLVLLRDLLGWIGLLSFGIGLANLLPIGPLDGGRMSLLACSSIRGKQKGQRAWMRISAVVLVLLLLNIFWPAIKFFFSFV